MNKFLLHQDKEGKLKGQKLLITGPVGKIELETYVPLFPLVNRGGSIGGEVEGKIGDKIDNNKSNVLDSNNPIKILVMCHPHPLYQGSMHNKVVTTAVSAFTKTNNFAVSFNFRGVGKSEGGYAGGVGEVDDLLAVCNWVKDSLPNAKIYLGGFSFGTYVAYQFQANAQNISKFNVAKILLIAPAVRKDFDFYNISQPSIPLSIIVPDADEVINPDDVLDWVRQLSCQYSLFKLKGISHFFHHNLKLLRDTIVQSCCL